MDVSEQMLGACGAVQAPAKECTQCHRVLPLTDYSPDKSTKDKRRSNCKTCKKQREAERRAKHPELCREQLRISYWRNVERRRADGRYQWRKNREKKRAYHRTYYAANRESVCRSVSEYQRTHRKEINTRQCAYEKRRRAEDPQYRMMRTLRSSVGDRVRQHGGKKSAHTWDLIGCSPDFLRKHLESQFQPGMTWENYGRYRLDEPSRWNIDHIIPCSHFDLTDPEQQRRCFHWTNLQPLWGVDNLKKGDKIIAEIS